LKVTPKKSLKHEKEKKKNIKAHRTANNKRARAKWR